MESPSFVDTHAHYNMPAFAGDLDEAIAAARKSGVERIICPAVSYASNAQMLDALSDEPSVYFALGIHPKLAFPSKVRKAKAPMEVREETAVVKRLVGAHQRYIDYHNLWIDALLELEREVESLRSLARSSDRVVAVGEAGLDYSLGPSEHERQGQVALFRLQIELALNLRLPLVLHVRDAHDEAMAVLGKYRGAATGVVHCFTGGRREADGYLGLGLHLGIGGRVTHDERPDCAELREAVASMPADRLLLETDAPYVLPKGFGPGRNDSTSIPLIAREVGRLRGEDVADVARFTTSNAERLFFQDRGGRA